MIFINGLVYLFTPDSVASKVKGLVAWCLKNHTHCFAQRFCEGWHGIHFVCAMLTTGLGDFDAAEFSVTSQNAHILEALGTN
ncbi:hypothetical protein D9M71_826260 [compost metagenome]